MILLNNLYNFRQLKRIQTFILTYQIVFEYVRDKKNNLFFSKDNEVDLNNFGTYNKEFDSVHFINTYHNIKDLLKILVHELEINNITNALNLNDIFIKNWNISDEQKKSFNFGKNVGLLFINDAEIYYDEINHFNFENNISLKSGDFLFLKNKHFIVKGYVDFHTIGLTYSKIDDILKYIIIDNDIYKDLENA